MNTNKRRGKAKKKVEKNRKTLIIRLALTLVAVFILFPISMFLYVYLEIPAPIPNEKALKQIENPEASIVYDAGEKMLGKYFIYERTTVEFDDISPNVAHALIATEDARFYEHKGVDYRSLMRVFFKTFLLGNESAGGGSTISQQLAKNLFAREDYGFMSIAVNKIREMIIATRLEDIYSKDEILTIYLNTVPFGDNVFGIESASERYFSKSCSQLEVQEAATLVGMLKGNTLYNPRIHPENSLKRRNVVLELMLREGFITDQEKNICTEKDLGLQLTENDQSEFAAYFLDRVALDAKKILSELKEGTDEYNLYTDGLKIYTTLDHQLQAYAESAIANQMTNLQQDFNIHWQNTKPWDRDKKILERAIESSDSYQSWKKKGLTEDQVLDSMNVKKNMEIFTWHGKKKVQFSSMDSIKYYLMRLHAGFIAMDPKTGLVKAWVGGVNHDFFKYDHVNVNTKRQVGSTFKPFVYATALDNGFSPCQYYQASQAKFVENEDEWIPSNADDEYEGKYSMEGALQNSVNTVSVKILEDVGVDEVIENCKDLGIVSEIPPYPSIALGTPSISLIEMATSYSCFVNKGRSVQPVYLLKIEDKEGNVLWENEKQSSKVVFSSETSALMIEMMKGVVDGGTADRLRSTYHFSNDFAGKTGTTQNNADGWFIGMLPDLVTAVWVGAESPAIHFRTTALGQGANTALPIFAEFFREVNKDPEYRSVAYSHFPNLSASLQKKMDCDPFKEEFKFLEFLFGKKKDREERRMERRNNRDDDKEGFFKKIKNIFKKKED